MGKISFDYFYGRCGRTKCRVRVLGVFGMGVAKVSTVCDLRLHCSSFGSTWETVTVRRAAELMHCRLHVLITVLAIADGVAEYTTTAQLPRSADLSPTCSMQPSLPPMKHAHLGSERYISDIIVHKEAGAPQVLFPFRVFLKTERGPYM
jgi:hypothetical protein